MPKTSDQTPPSSSKTSVERGQSARAKLLEAAAELIGEVGWNAVSTRMLADRAGVRSGLVHYHFESLQDVLRKAALAEMKLVVDRTSVLFGEGSSDDSESIGFDSMFAELDAYDGSDSSSQLVVEAYLAATRDPVLQEQMKVIMTDFRDVVSTSLARAGHPNPRTAAVALLAILDGLFLHKGLDPSTPVGDVASLIESFVAVEEKGRQS